MRMCCDDQQMCYHKCGADKNKCDQQFSECLLQKCIDSQKDPTLLKGIESICYWKYINKAMTPLLDQVARRPPNCWWWVSSHSAARRSKTLSGGPVSVRPTKSFETLEEILIGLRSWSLRLLVKDTHVFNVEFTQYKKGQQSRSSLIFLRWLIIKN